MKRYVSRIIAGTKNSLMVVPITFLGKVVPSNVVGTRVHINSLNIGQFDYKTISKFFLGCVNKKNIVLRDMATFTK